jgi:hypothetical protein
MCRRSRAGGSAPSWHSPSEPPSTGPSGSDEEDGDRYDRFLEVYEVAALGLHAAAEAEIARLVEAGRLRFMRGGRTVSALIRAGWRQGLANEEAETLEDETECGLLELVEAGLPEWVEYSKAEWLTPPEFRGPVAVLQEIPPACLDENGRFVEPGWLEVENEFRRQARPESLEWLRPAVQVCEGLVRAFLARRAIIEVFGRELGLDLLPPMLRERNEAIRDLAAAYNPLAALSQESQPDEEDFNSPEWALPLPRDLRLPPIDISGLKPEPAEVERMREALATLDAQAWWEAALELGVVGAVGTTDPELEEQVRQRGREPDSFNITADESMA